LEAFEDGDKQSIEQVYSFMVMFLDGHLEVEADKLSCSIASTSVLLLLVNQSQASGELRLNSCVDRCSSSRL
jgi:hypothetical protein